MKVSVVINTYNRANYIREAIISLSYQNYQNFEAVVVNGPSTDNTDEVLEKLENEGFEIKRATCPTRNLSESRNIGIKNSSGDIICFMDDDARAHSNWIKNLVFGYSGKNVGAVGGFTIDYSGMEFQCKNTICDRFGNAYFLDNISSEVFNRNCDEVNFFPSLLGTNSSFRGDILRKIGGFDEAFAYMLDETDVCLRIAKMGYEIITLKDALILHKYAPSYTRTSERIPASLESPAKSRAYFTLKHGANITSSESEMKSLQAYRKDIEFSNRWFVDNGKITAKKFDNLMDELDKGLNDGIGLIYANNNKPTVQIKINENFISFGRKKNSNNDGMVLYLVSQGYPPFDTSGIARWTHEVAEGLKIKGHEVHVITRSRESSSNVDLIDGVWIHSIVDTPLEDIKNILSIDLPGNIICRADAVYREIIRSIKIFGGDLISVPIWDLEGAIVAQYKPLPLIVSLHTTYSLMLDYKSDWKSNRRYLRKHVKPIIQGERWMYENADLILANSNAILKDISFSQNCDNLFENKIVKKVFHGSGSYNGELIKKSWVKNEYKLLFVGRIEERKGLDILLRMLSIWDDDDIYLTLDVLGSYDENSNYFKDVIKPFDCLLLSKKNLKVNYLGYVDDLELEKYYKTSQIMIVPSRYESFGLIAIEAMQWGLPVIANNTGGLEEVVSVISKELIFSETPESLMIVLKKLINNEDYYLQIINETKFVYDKYFSRKSMVNSLEEIYKIALNLEEKYVAR